MLLNYETVLVGDRVVLVPYRLEHVLRYHGWMQHPDLLAATASEPLTLQEEYEMQESWRQDRNKCTFIVLAKECVVGLPPMPPSSSTSSAGKTTAAAEQSYNQEEIPSPSGEEDPSQPSFCVPLSSVSNDFIESNIPAMIGDVNLFFSGCEEEEESECNGGGGGNNNQQQEIKSEKPPTTTKAQDKEENYIRRQAEIDIMIAEPNYRGNGMGKEAATVMMLFATTARSSAASTKTTTTNAAAAAAQPALKICRIFCKIQETNTASLSLFLNGLGFAQCGYAACFHEIELELKCKTPQDMTESLLTRYKSCASFQPFHCPLSSKQTESDCS